MRYAEIIVDISREQLDRTFSYRIPCDMQDRILVGSVVEIPFGKGNRIVRGYVVDLKQTSDLSDDKLKEIQRVVTDEETVDSKMVSLAAWMSHTYGSTTIQALKTVIPVKKKIKPVQKQFVSLKDTALAKHTLEEYSGKKYKARIRVLEKMLGMQDEAIPLSELLRECRTTRAVVQDLSDRGLLQIDVSEEYRRVTESHSTHTEDDLSEEQRQVTQAIRREFQQENRPVLLQGITGSGKTHVYMELIQDVLDEGKQVIVLIPEIALTRQIVNRFLQRFGNQVSFLHSRLSMGERYDQMKAARKGDLSIMVGPRSALFTPFHHIGLIIIDEEHEDTYQSEQMPRYDAREVAEFRCQQDGAHLLLGSATPSVRTMYLAEAGKYFRCRLKNRFGQALLPKTSIVDMREELRRGNRSIFSDQLRREIRDRLDKKEQVLLFLNRRGYEGHMTCRSCGHVIKCPHCDVSLTLHGNQKMVCHYCGYEQHAGKACPNCNSLAIGGLSIGTEQVETVTQELFPDARILRMDADTTKHKEGHSRILNQFERHEADILIGTQMIVKGHDFPLVTLVGVLMADLSLNESNYQSQERTFQLITQAVGRAGRGTKRGSALIQTYHPDHPVILSAAAQNYDRYFAEEIAYRTILSYPPKGYMMGILASSEQEQLLDTAMDYLKKYIQHIDPHDALHTLGPAPQSVGKIRDRYRRVIYVRHEQRNQLIRAKDFIEAYIRVNPGFSRIEIQFDMNV